MFQIYGKSLTECAYKLIKEVWNYGQVIESRNGACSSLYNVDICLRNPRARELQLIGRKNCLPSVYAELFWILSGSNEIEPFLSFFLKRAKDYSDDGKRWRGGYGARLWTHNQFQSVLKHFEDDKYTRRAVQTIYDASLDNYIDYQKESKEMKDVPCNNWIQYYIIPKEPPFSSNDRFCMKVVQRSGDVIWGITNVNMFVFSALQEIMYEMVKIKYPDIDLGDYIHSVTNAHIYHNDIVKRQVEQILDNNERNRDIIEKMNSNDGKLKIGISDIAPFGINQIKNMSIQFIEICCKFMESKNDKAYDRVEKLFDEYKIQFGSSMRYYAIEILKYIENKGE